MHTSRQTNKRNFHPTFHKAKLHKTTSSEPSALEFNQLGQNPTIQRIGDELESKWINVKTLPQQILNNSQEAYQNMRGQLNQWGQQVFGPNKQQ